METYLHYFMQYFIGFHQISLNQTSLTQKVKTELFVLRTDSQLNIMNSEENCISIFFFLGTAHGRIFYEIISSLLYIIKIKLFQFSFKEQIYDWFYQKLYFVPKI